MIGSNEQLHPNNICNITYSIWANLMSIVRRIIIQSVIQHTHHCSQMVVIITKLRFRQTKIANYQFTISYSEFFIITIYQLKYASNSRLFSSLFINAKSSKLYLYQIQPTNFLTFAPVTASYLSPSSLSESLSPWEPSERAIWNERNIRLHLSYCPESITCDAFPVLQHTT